MKERITKERLIASTSVLLASFTLSACGNELKKDKGSAEIKACPSGFALGSEPLANPGQAHNNLQKGVAEFTNSLPILQYDSRIGVNDLDVDYGSVVQDRRNVNGVANTIFYVDEGGFFYGEDEYIIEPENKVDDLSETLCSDKGKVYYSPQAQQAIGSLSTVGINVVTTPQNPGQK